MDICTRRVLMVKTLLSATIALAATAAAYKVRPPQLTSLASIVASIATLGVWTLNALISIAAIALLTRSLTIATAMSAWLFELGSAKPGSTLFAAITIASWLIVVLPLASIASIRGGLGDSLLDRKSWRQAPFLTPIPLGLLVALITLELLEAPKTLSILHLAFTGLSSIIVAFYSHSISEAIILGALSGLGPLGLVIAGSRIAFSHIDPGACPGIPVGRLVSIEDTGIRVKMATSGGSIFSMKSVGPVCTKPLRAVLALRDQAIIWVYGRAPKRLFESLLPRPALIIRTTGHPMGGDLEELLSDTSTIIAAGGTAEVSLDPSQAQIVIGVAELLVDTAGDSGAKAVLVEAAGLGEDFLKRIAARATRKIGLTIVAINNVPWTSPSLMPRFYAASSGIIAIGVEDPGDRAKIASTLFSSNEARSLARKLLSSKEYGIGYPYCNGKPFIFKIARDDENREAGEH